MTETAKMYGGSLYSLAVEEKLEAELLDELEAVADLFRQNSDYMRLLNMQNLPKKERCALLDEAFRGNVHPYVLNFMKLLCENGTLRELRGCARAYRMCYNKANGIAEATAVCAKALTAEQTEALRQKLEKVSGKKVDLTVKVDAGILGGIRVEMDGVQLDGSVRKSLEGLRSSIASAAL